MSLKTDQSVDKNIKFMDDIFDESLSYNNKISNETPILPYDDADIASNNEFVDYHFTPENELSFKHLGLKRVYDLAIFAFDKKEDMFDYLCHGCGGVYLNPRLDSQGHCMCKECLEYIYHNKIPCPNGGEMIESLKFIDVNVIGNVLTKKTVICCYKSCDWVGLLGEFDNHVNNDCKYHSLTCPYSNCGQQYMRYQMGQHMHKCKYKTETCKYCKINLLVNELNQHYKQCPDYPIPCVLGCPEIIERQKMESHLLNCDKKLINCCFEKLGCPELVEKGSINDHLIRNIHSHSLLMINNVNEKNDNINNDLDQMMKEVSINFYDLGSKIQLALNEFNLIFQTKKYFDESLLKLVLERGKEVSLKEKPAKITKIVDDEEEDENLSNDNDASEVKDEEKSAASSKKSSIPKKSESKRGIYNRRQTRSSKVKTQLKLKNKKGTGKRQPIRLNLKKEQPTRENIPYNNITTRNQFRNNNIRNDNLDNRLIYDYTNSQKSVNFYQEKFLIKSSSDGIRFSFFDLKKGTKTFGIRIDKMQSMIAVGLFDIYLVKECQFKLKYKDSKGCFAVTSQGKVINSSLEIQNNVETNFTFEQGDFLLLSINDKMTTLKVTNLESQESVTISGIKSYGPKEVSFGVVFSNKEDLVYIDVLEHYTSK